MDNALRAMKGGGRLTLMTEQVGGELQVTIKDTGVGIPDQDLERIFDPFFTTPGAGEGTGLGLALCRQILERHQGRMEVESKLGVGTRFDLYLPVKPASVNERLPLDRGLVARA